MEDIAIKVDRVSKDFHYTSNRAGTIKSIFTNIFRNKEDAKKDIQHALKDVSFEIKKGEFFGIVGRNGSGKSTLLKMIAGIYQPNKGEISVNGKLVPFIELGVGFNPELTGRENIYLNGALLGFSKKEVDDQYDEIVEFAELEKFMDQQLKNYSSGMQVRLAFSMAIRAKADILLIDEVLAVGDADFQRKCFNYFNKLKKDKATVVFVSHNMEAVREYCDRAIMIESSEVIDIGATDKIAEKYLRLFLDEEARTQGTVGDEDRWGDGSIKTTEATADVSDTTITITQSIKAMVNNEAPIPGFRIKDATGQHLTGTNTKVEHVNLPSMTAGQTTTIVWTVPNIFRDGQYTIDLAILQKDEITATDWWNEALVIKVKKPRHLPYVVDPGFKVKVIE